MTGSVVQLRPEPMAEEVRWWRTPAHGPFRIHRMTPEEERAHRAKWSNPPEGFAEQVAYETARLRDRDRIERQIPNVYHAVPVQAVPEWPGKKNMVDLYRALCGQPRVDIQTRWEGPTRGPVPWSVIPAEPARERPCKRCVRRTQEAEIGKPGRYAPMWAELTRVELPVAEGLLEGLAPRDSTGLLKWLLAERKAGRVW